MKAPRVPAKDVRVGDRIQTCYYPRTWQLVTAIERTQDRIVNVMIDTDRDRTWYAPDDLVRCQVTLVASTEQAS